MAHRYPNLTTNILLQIHELFRVRGWPLNNNASINLYHRFCERLSIFDEDEQLLLLKLTQTFERIPADEFVENIWSAYCCIPEVILKNASRIFFMPLLEIGSTKKKETKSSQALHYLLKISDYDWIDYNQKFLFFEDPNDLVKYFDDKTLLILIDDFIGSGDTACKAIRSYKNLDIKFTSSNLLILSMVSQEIGIKAVKKATDQEVYASRIFHRGISDNFSSETVQPNLVLMKTMERKISNQIEKNGWSLGYAQSEALVCMSNKTPNNTFPVFWVETETKLSPFPRYHKFKGNLL